MKNLIKQLIPICCFFFCSSALFGQVLTDFPCFSVAKNNGSSNNLYVYDSESNYWNLAGATGTNNIAAISADSETGILYAVDSAPTDSTDPATFGTIDPQIGVFTPIGVGIGEAMGENGVIMLNQIEGLTYDDVNLIMYAVHRVDGTGEGTNDLLFQIDVATGSVVPFAMVDSNGNPADYAVIPEIFDGTAGADIYDVSDIAIHPSGDAIYNNEYAGELFAMHAENGPGAISTINKLNGEINSVIFDIPDDDVESLGFTFLGELYATTGDNGITQVNSNTFIFVDFYNGTTTILSPISETEPGDVDFESFDCFHKALPNSSISEMSTFIYSPKNRCKDTIQFNISTQNTGTTNSSGTLWFQVDTLITGVEYVDMPDTIIEPNQYGWFFEGLMSGQQLVKQINLTIPGLSNIEFGEFLNYTSFSEYNDENGSHSTALFKYDAEIKCAFDPNDKAVSPIGPCDYTLFGETLNYTIRFQNTGNDTARNVIIRDTLDVNLDLSTFMILDNSHPSTLNFNLNLADNLLSFEFTAINLPDSIANLEGSQGYISYSIKANEDLAENTVIKNSSGIYFDDNPAIITNTVQSVMVSEIPTYIWCKDFDMDGLGDAMDMIESCNQPEGYVADCTDPDDLVDVIELSINNLIHIYPNPSTGIFKIDADLANFKSATISLFNASGKQIVQPSALQLNHQWTDYHNLTNGVYYLNIRLDDKILRKKVVVVK